MLCDKIDCVLETLSIVTLHRISGNKVIACTWHVMTHSHAVNLTRLTCDYAKKNN